MIVRLIVFIAFFAIGWWLYRQFIMFKSRQSSATPEKKEKTKASKEEDKQESMVRCEQCQTFIPRSHAIHDQDARAFCSAEHLKAFNQKAD